MYIALSLSYKRTKSNPTIDCQYLKFNAATNQNTAAKEQSQIKIQ